MTQSFDKNYAQSFNRDAHSEVLSYGAKNIQPKKRVGILGGGTAGSTIAIRLAHVQTAQSIAHDYRADSNLQARPIPYY